jgi:hypothetical protein
LELAHVKRRDNDSRAVADFVQAHTLGRAVDDDNDIHPMDDGPWADLIGRFLRNVLAEPDN